jgi:hypothetical protein
MMATYKKCFVGTAFVDWLVENKYASTKPEAISLGQ